MTATSLEQLASSPEYLSLARRRRRLCYTLAGLNMFLYLAYVLSMGYAREWMTTPFGAINVGLAWTIFLIVFAVVLSGIYVWWTRRHFDPALARLVAGLEQS
ncbi:MAG: DUF485 domain-containing protein [Pseudomonadota bacterium]